MPVRIIYKHNCFKPSSILNQSDIICNILFTNWQIDNGDWIFKAGLFGEKVWRIKRKKSEN